MIEFISSLYNEQAEVADLIMHVLVHVDMLNLVDDGSTDDTVKIIKGYQNIVGDISLKEIEHTGLCEVGRIHALEMCQDDSWVIMLDADERFDDGVLNKIEDFCDNYTGDATHIYFSQKEEIDGIRVAEFAKVKVFKKSAVTLPEIIHKEPIFTGTPISGREIDGQDWTVWHRKSAQKQVNREIEYLSTYKRLLDAGKITNDDLSWFVSMHHFVKPKG